MNLSDLIEENKQKGEMKFAFREAGFACEWIYDSPNWSIERIEAHIEGRIEAKMEAILHFSSVRAITFELEKHEIQFLKKILRFINEKKSTSTSD